MTTTQSPGATSEDRARWFAEQFGAIRDNVATVIRGKHDVIDLALVCMMADGHLLIEDVPGVGKTSLARAIAASIFADWSRIQFTPDLLPSDVTGVSVYNQRNGEFEFKAGPVFAKIVLGDEINRASPKTQSALLEVMEEYQVTIDGHAHPVERPFMVIATQNPVEMDGTYPLPEAQLDRFLMRMKVGYPDAVAEAEVLDGHRRGQLLEQLRPVASPEVVRAMIAVAAETYLAPTVRDYIIRIVATTREAPEVRLGASPRGSLALMRTGRARALTHERGFVLPEDVRALAVPVLAHRLLLAADARLRGITPEAVVTKVLERIPVPKPATVS